MQLVRTGVAPVGYEGGRAVAGQADQLPRPIQGGPDRTRSIAGQGLRLAIQELVVRQRARRRRVRQPHTGSPSVPDADCPPPTQSRRGDSGGRRGHVPSQTACGWPASRWLGDGSVWPGRSASRSHDDCSVRVPSDPGRNSLVVAPLHTSGSVRTSYLASHLA
jgi:hypothetical protein